MAATIIVVIALFAGCSGNDTSANPPADTAPAADEASVDVHGLNGIIQLNPAAPERCEFLGGGGCMLPFPSDRFLTADASTPTGKRVAFDSASMPTNADGVPIDPAEWNRNDGFSPGAAVVVKVPGVDLAVTGAAPVSDIGSSLDPDAPIVIVDTQTGQRWPYWAELDANATGDDDRTLLVRPARNFADGHRYVVGLRNLKHADGSTIEPPGGFRAYRDRLFTDIAPMEARRSAMEGVIDTLVNTGVARNELYLAWDFTVASTDGLTGRALHLRDDAFAALGDRAPTFTVTTVDERPDPSDPVARVVEGTLDVPNYLTGAGEPGTTLNNTGNPNGIPTRNGTYAASVLCVVPRSGPGVTRTAQLEPPPAVVYGHGLLGGNSETRSVGSSLVAQYNVVVCGTPLIGMSSDDTASIGGILANLSTFATMPDRLQQAMLNTQFLARALKHPEGLGAMKEFQSADGTPLLSGEVTYVGNSQGGILGGAISAVATDWTRAFLGVPGMNYSTLLNRSVDFDAFGPLLSAGYPAKDTQQLALGLIQMLWDRGENNGYANHLTADPLPGAPTKQVLLFGAFGDHQVANVTTDVLARTIGARVRQPALADGRSTDVTPFWGIEPLDAPPARGTGYVMWDFATPAPPLTNTPNRAGDDPHGKGAEVPEVLQLALRFVLTGDIEAACAGPCRTP
jgi:hypothetical protein